MKALRIVGWFAGGFAVILLIIAAVGWMLPVSHRASGRATFDASPRQLYALITGVDSFPAWRSNVSRVEKLPPVNGRMSYREIGGDGTITYVVDEAVPDQRVVTRIADPDLPFGGRWLFTLRAVGGKTELEIVEEGEVYNPIFRFMSRFVFGHTSSIDRYLADVGRRFPLK